MRFHEGLFDDIVHEFVTARVLMAGSSTEGTFQVFTYCKYARISKAVIIVRRILTSVQNTRSLLL
jgi:hypothetical protein